MKKKHYLTTFGFLFSIAAGAIHFVNKSIIESSSYKNMLKASKNHDIYQWRFGKIYYTKKGTGKPLLLIHDLLPGASNYEWHKIESELSKEHEVYTIDLPGCGQSEKPQLTYTNFFYVQLLCDFIRQIIGKKTDVIASGYSSSFSIMACSNEGDLFDKLLLINPPSFSSLNQIPDRNSRLQKLILEMPVFGTMIFNIAMSRQSIEHLFSEKLFYNPFHVDSKFLDAFYESAHRDGCKSKYVYASQVGKYTNINIKNNLKKLDHSIYIIEGKQEDHSQKILESYQNVNPAIEVSYVEHTKHFPHLEYPEDFLNQTRIYL